MGCLKLTYQQKITVLNVVYTAENDTFPGEQAAKKEPSKLEVAYREANSGGVGGETWNSINNYMTGTGLAVDGGAYQLGRVLDKRLAYQFTKAAYEGWKSPVGSTSFKTIIGTINADTKLVQRAATSLKVGGAVLGGIGVVMTGVEIYNGNKSLVGEGGIDLIMGGVGFIPGWGWAASGLYFGGKYILQETGNDFWNK